MDVVYILGSGSVADNKEILYSVRSLALNMLDIGKVFVVGEKPPDLPGVIHIPASDYTKIKWKNAYYKTLKACRDERISEEFLLMNDDFFMLKPFMGSDWPFYSLLGSNGGNCGALSFAIHCPIRIKKDWYLNMPFPIDSKGHLSPRTFYANFYKAPQKYCRDFILRANKFAPVFQEQVKDWPCFSLSNESFLDPQFLLWLDSLFPDPSPFESKSLS